MTTKMDKENILIAWKSLQAVKGRIACADVAEFLNDAGWVSPQGGEITRQKVYYMMKQTEEGRSLIQSPNHVPKDRYPELVERHQRGESFAKIARDFGVTASATFAIWKKLVEAGEVTVT